MMNGSGTDQEINSAVFSKYGRGSKYGGERVETFFILLQDDRQAKNLEVYKCAFLEQASVSGQGQARR